MKKFEYKLVRTPYNVDVLSELNRLGDEGWQCISIEQTSEGGAHALYLMREKVS